MSRQPPEQTEVLSGSLQLTLLYREGSMRELEVEPLGAGEIASIWLAGLEGEARAELSSCTWVLLGAEKEADARAELLCQYLQEAAIDCRRVLRDCLAIEAGGGRGGWLVEGRSDRRLERALGGAEQVRFVSDIRPFEFAKRWLVNGGQLALALWAREIGLTTLDDGEGPCAEWVQDFQQPIVEVLRRRWGALASCSAYGGEYLRWRCRERGEVEYIMRRMRRSDLMPFIEEVERKLGDPAEALAWNGVAPSAYRETLYRLQALLSDINQYRDGLEIEAGLLSIEEDDDDAVLQRYTELLYRVFPKEEAGRMGRQLRRAFKGHREAVG